MSNSASHPAASSDERAHAVLLDSGIVSRFWPKVSKSDGCWEWTGSTTSGYRSIQSVSARRPLYAHRVSFAIHFPNVDLTKKLVLHRCDNRLCVRPDHLFVGSSADNARDAWAKGRSVPPPNPPKGEAHHSAKLTKATVESIRARLHSGERVIDLAVEFNVSRSSIYKIKRGKTWKA